MNELIKMKIGKNRGKAKIKGSWQENSNKN
jgi:hypothetical protein